MPILGWLLHYNAKWFVGDTIAGISVWALPVPQALAYATDRDASDRRRGGLAEENGSGHAYATVREAVAAAAS